MYLPLNNLNSSQFFFQFFCFYILIHLLNEWFEFVKSIKIIIKTFTDYIKKYNDISYFDLRISFFLSWCNCGSAGGAVNATLFIILFYYIYFFYESSIVSNFNSKINNPFVKLFIFVCKTDLWGYKQLKSSHHSTHIHFLQTNI